VQNINNLIFLIQQTISEDTASNMFFLIIIVFALIIILGKLKFLAKILTAMFIIAIIMIIYYVLALILPQFRIPVVYEVLEYLLNELIELLKELGLGGLI